VGIENRSRTWLNSMRKVEGPMATKKLFMETTSVEPQKTAAEITALLVSAGARQIAMTYGAVGELKGLAFTLVIEGGMMPFSLPVRTEPIFKLLNGRRKYSWDRTESAPKDRAQAERVAWRQLLRWIQAQLAMIDVGMVAAQEVFLPYMQSPDGRTIYELFASSQFKQLAAPDRGKTQ
jgi:hypothetical protein